MKLMVSKGKNLLDEWYNAMFVKSSKLQINEPKIDRKQVDIVYQRLKEPFGPNFFISVQAGKAMLDQNWLHQLLVNTEHYGSFLLLKDYAELTCYSKTLGPEFFKTIKKLQTNPDNLRSYFFELFTFRLLDDNKIANTKKFYEGAQEKEGECSIMQQQYLFECRKLYIPSMAAVDVKTDITGHLTLSLQTRLKHAQGMIFTIDLKRPNENATKSKFKTKIDEFISQLNKWAGARPSIDYICSDDDGLFAVSDYTIDRRLELEASNEHDIVALLIPPTIITPGAPAHFSFQVTSTQSIAQSDIAKHFIAKIKEKRKQHATSQFERKIFFFDSESFPQFRMGLFQRFSMLDEQTIQAEIDQSDSNKIVCLILRDYTADIPKKLIWVFCKEGHKAVKQILSNLRI